MRGKEITQAEAERWCMHYFGVGVPTRCMEGRRAQFSLESDVLFILDKENDTLWGITTDGEVSHRGLGDGCFWTKPEQWFTPISPFPKPMEPSTKPETAGQNRTALDALLGVMHEKYQKMNELCIDIMHSNLDLMRQIIELRMELAEGREDGPNDSSKDGVRLASGAVDHGTV